VVQRSAFPATQTGFGPRTVSFSSDHWPLARTTSLRRVKSVPLRHVKPCVSDQFFYLQFRIRSKNAVTAQSVGSAQEVALEVPRKLIEDWKEENPDQTASDQSIAADIARVVAMATAFPGTKQREYEWDAPRWIEQRAPVMNARACDYHDNGIRAWLIRLHDEGASAE
jgi:hypothetical protein